MSVRESEGFVIKREELGDMLVYGMAAGVGQALSHLLLAQDPRLPRTQIELNARYVVGSGINLLIHLTYAVRHPHGRVLDGVKIHAGILGMCFAVVSLLQLGDYLHDRAVANAMDETFDGERGGQRYAATRGTISLPRRNRS